MNVTSVSQPIWSASLASGTTQSASSSSSYEELQNATEIISQEDSDGNGSLSVEETSLSQEMFSNADSDGDGLLSEDELEAYLESGPGASGGARALSEMDASSILEAEDADGSGTLSFEETSLTEKMFATADSNGDGTLDENEIASYISTAPDAAGIQASATNAASIIEDDEETSTISAANAFAISTYERVSSNFMSLLSQGAEMYSDSYLSNLVV